ncbi:hypothetical protein DAPPUDRAFT_238299 [Daphnia pulex]|uniref:Uncharacterized protein n=1 Tax=Daphnia pulex TaxID=6669 RepID=E9G623_DAPPU|nr:hypothetical protein DAPPUDRAFT_238299 [Daphnia pulex]|eukprot:EFX85069.1 hypothetical protein DAPPUDRAFT_238299 [Daphnia pulex]
MSNFDCVTRTTTNCWNVAIELELNGGERNESMTNATRFLLHHQSACTRIYKQSYGFFLASFTYTRRSPFIVWT